MDAASALGDAVSGTNAAFAGAGTSDVAAARRAMVRLVIDSTQSRAVRYDMLRWLAISPCTNLRELVFGFAPDVEEAFSSARRTLARSASDSAYIHLVERTPERVQYYVDKGATLTAARIAGRVLFNPRLAGCTVVVLGNAR